MKKLLALILLFVLLLGLVSCGSRAHSIGIIGGADGPTAIFVTYGTNWQNIGILIGIIVLVIVSIPVIRHSKKKK